MAGDVTGKNIQRAPHQANRTVGMATSSTPVHFSQTTMESLEDAVVSLATGYLGQIICDCGKAIDARTALAGTLVGQVSGDPGGLGEAAGGLAERDDHADACRGADRP